MFDKKELSLIIILPIVLGFIFGGFKSSRIFLYCSLSLFLIILINSFFKKIAGSYFESDVKIGLWEMNRFGWRSEYRFKKPLPAGVIFPLIVKVITLGKMNWLAFLTFDVEAKVSRAARRHDIYTFSELSEYHLGVIAAWGIVANLFFALIAYLIGIPKEINFVNLSIYYTLFNMIPFSDLDGNKIFFGSMVLWTFLASIVLLCAVFSFLIV